MAVTDPVQELRRGGGARRAATAPAGGSDARAPQAGRTTATTRPTRRCCWPRCSARRRARSPSSWRTGCATSSAPALERRRGRGPGLPQPVPRRRLVRGRWSASSPPARASGPGGAEQPRAGERRVRLGQPDRAADCGQRAQRRLRRRARAAALVRRPRRRARVLLQRLRRAGRASSARRSRRGRAARSPRGRLRGRVRGRARGRAIPGAAERACEELARRGRRADVRRASARRSRAFGVEFDGVQRAPCTRATRAPIEARAAPSCARSGHVYESEGALWLRTTDFGDDKDRVLERSTGERTYFASDVAYQPDKRERGFDRLINVLGADHHGYVARMKALLAALGGEPDRLEIPIMQFVHLVEGGERASMSKRRGDFVTLDELIAEIGVDATRFFLLQRSHDTTIDLDLDLRQGAVRREPRLLRAVRARADRVDAAQGGGGARGARAVGRPGATSSCIPSERALIAKLLACPEEVAEAAERRAAAPHRHLRARARPGLHGVLPRLPGGGRRARGARVLPPRAVASRRSRRSRGRSTSSA